MNELVIKNLHVSVEGKPILRGVNLALKRGAFHAIMGPNGSGKSTLAQTLMGHPRYTVTRGDILVDGESILDLSPDERARKGLFLGFQYPSEVPGVTVTHFLLSSYRALHGQGDGDDGQPRVDVLAFRKKLGAALKKLEMKEVAGRFLNTGFSGGEKKRSEILQMLVLRPRFAVLDEIDSGLDIDALKTVAANIHAFHEAGNGVLLITHYQRILHHLKPDAVHVMMDGRIAASGGPELAARLEKEGYRALRAAASGKR